MFCPNCGRANLESDNFCRYCGKRLTEEPAQETPTPVPEPAQEPVAEFTPEPTPEPSTPPDTDFSIEEPAGERRPEPSPFAPPVSPAPSFDLRSILNAPVILAALIAFSAALVFNLLGISDLSFLAADTLYGAEEFDALFSLSAFSSVVSLVPTALIVAGSWMTYASVKNGQKKDAGLTMIKVALILQLVFVCIMLVLFELICIVAAVMMFNYDSFTSSFDLEPLELEEIALPIMQGLFVFLIVLIAAAIALAIIYYVKAFKTVEVIRGTIVTGVPSDRISGFVAVFLCIAGGLVALSAFNLLLYGGFFSVLSSACSATAYICFGVFLFGYRSKMRALMTTPGSI